MQLEIDCTWNNKKNQAKILVMFDFLPKKLFSLPKEKIYLLHQLRGELPMGGPPVLDKIREFWERHPKSLYAAYVYYRALDFFELEEECWSLLREVQKRFPGELYTRCIEGALILKGGNLDHFWTFFDETEVLKGVFPKRKCFFVEEALFFHHLWIEYYSRKGDEQQYQQHDKFSMLIVQTLQAFRRSMMEEEVSGS